MDKDEFNNRQNWKNKSEEFWKQRLAPDEYRVLRNKGTEPAFSGEYYASKEKGVYLCRGCGQELFNSETKFESGTGWPSFWEPISNENIELQRDSSHGMLRVEVTCARCGGHLGHVFEDAPTPTRKRFCMNSTSLKLKK